ncbi:hypothetical protein QUC26_09305 [Pseudomonas asiatica]|uniref:hypothetical protein n=1 Tax=Pseudomonas asiatica TaxID=2219225 RepID=UPI0025A17642|nr:hypothetical protein [Pseudomonas asiatica]WJM55325.1 hypothetical protein QUC26_09305 [Pseudomonas asiatica]
MTRLTGRACEHCNKPFLAVRSSHRFCCNLCRQQSHRAKHKVREEAKTTFAEYITDAISQLSQSEIVGALGVLWNETPEERKERKESLLLTLMKQKGKIQ